MTKTICADFLDKSHAILLEGRVFAGMSHLVTSLRYARDASNADDWNQFCLEECPRHPIHNLLQQDLFTNHSFRRPRGYVGDPELMDIIYHRGIISDAITSHGHAINDFTVNIPVAQSVRTRRVVLSATLDVIAPKKASASVLSVACGHLREVEFSCAVQDGGIKTLTAFDWDEQSLAEVRRCSYDLNIETVAGSVGDILKGSAELDSYDFIYSIGLYDSLTAPTARHLTAKLFDLLHPGGTLLISNFLPTIPDAGYMEAFMRWPLVYRTAEDMEDITCMIPQSTVSGRDCFHDPLGYMVFLELTKK